MKKITNYEYQSAVYLLSFPLFMGAGLSKLIAEAQSDIWISIIIGTIFGLIINFILTKLPNKCNKICKLISTTSLLFFGIIILSKLISSIYLSNTPSFLIIIPLTSLAIFSATKGIETFYKTSGILLIIFMIFFIFAALTLAPTVKIDFFLPIATSSFKNIIYSAIHYALISTLPLILLPNFKEHYKARTYILSSITILIMAIATLGNLGPEIATLYRYPEYMVFKKISILKFIDNIENILFSIWIIVSCEINHISALNLIKEIKTKGLIIISILIYIVCSKFIIDNHKALDFLIYNYQYVLLGILTIFIIGKLISKKEPLSSNNSSRSSWYCFFCMF